MSKIGSALWILTAVGAPLVLAFLGCNNLASPYGTQDPEKNIGVGTTPPIGTHFAGGGPSWLPASGAGASSSGGNGGAAGTSSAVRVSPTNLCECGMANVSALYGSACQTCFAKAEQSPGCAGFMRACTRDGGDCSTDPTVCLLGCAGTATGVGHEGCVEGCLATAAVSYLNILQCACTGCVQECQTAAVACQCTTSGCPDAGSNSDAAAL